MTGRWIGSAPRFGANCSPVAALRRRRLVRWRIPGIPGDISFDELFRRPPFLLLEEHETSLMSGIVGRIWTLRRLAFRPAVRKSST